VRRFALIPLLFALAACGGGGRPEAVIQTKDGEVVVRVEIADTPAERARGLMGRRHLEADSGMVFPFPEDTTAAFWMKDTLVPLSIAFYDGGGKILRILDMVPCKSDSCPVYSPGVSYRGALEVNLGAFRRWGVREGDELRLER
jgi:uncharacterized membrane protein (UPF0127 family)